MENLINQKFNRLTVLSQFRKNNHSYCTCQCQCGTIKDIRTDSLKNGSIQSCGCLHKEILSSKYEDLTGLKFNNWLVLSKAERPETTKNRGTYWLCRCKCGTEKIVWGKSLKDGTSKSCGCIKGEKHIIDLTGKTFTRLRVIKRDTTKPKGNGAYWICQCECGNIISVRGHSLLSNHTKSCGCLSSYGEEVIAKLLSENHIEYRKEYTFEDLNDINKLRFDFAIFNNNQLYCLIEVQGSQHYENSPNSSWNSPVEHDNMKKEYCKKNNIKLFEIKYDAIKEINIQKLKETICLE